MEMTQAAEPHRYRAPPYNDPRRMGLFTNGFAAPGAAVYTAVDDRATPAGSTDAWRRIPAQSLAVVATSLSVGRARRVCICEGGRRMELGAKDKGVQRPLLGYLSRTKMK